MSTIGGDAGGVSSSTTAQPRFSMTGPRTGGGVAPFCAVLSRDGFAGGRGGGAAGAGAGPDGAGAGAEGAGVGLGVGAGSLAMVMLLS
jgi:hypothetical protein